MSNQYYKRDYTKSEIDAVLSRIKECVENDRFQVSMNENRQENISFINEYNLYHKKRKRLLLEITVDDFCHTLRNMKKGYEDEVLYVFVPRVVLYNAVGEKESVDVYTKFNLIKREDGDWTVVISLHKLNRPVEYLFRKEKKHD